MTAFHRKNPCALPSSWLMTDERIDDATLMRAIARLPRGAGIVFRHHASAPDRRKALFLRVRGEARRRGLTLLLAGSRALACAWGADGWHGPARGSVKRWMIHSASVHSVREMRSAERMGASLLFLSPVFPTRSHPGASALGKVRFGLLARQAGLPVIALGGMTAARASSLKAMGIYGWAAIDGWIAAHG